MAKFAYNNAKNANIGRTSFKLKYKFHSYVFLKKDINSYSRSCLAKELAKKLRDLMSIDQQNLLYVQKLQKQAHNKSVKL